MEGEVRKWKEEKRMFKDRLQNLIEDLGREIDFSFTGKGANFTINFCNQVAINERDFLAADWA